MHFSICLQIPFTQKSTLITKKLWHTVCAFFFIEKQLKDKICADLFAHYIQQTSQNCSEYHSHQACAQRIRAKAMLHEFSITVNIC